MSENSAVEFIIRIKWFISDSVQYYNTLFLYVEHNPNQRNKIFLMYLVFFFLGVLLFFL